MDKIKALLFIDFNKHYKSMIITALVWLMGFSIFFGYFGFMFSILMALTIVVIESPSGMTDMKAYINVLPICAETTVLTKYLFKLLVCLCVTVMIFLLSIVNNSVIPEMGVGVSEVFYGLGIMLINSAIATPVNFMQGKRSTDQAFYFIVLLFNLLFFVGWNERRMVAYGYFIAILGAVLFVLSIPLSIRLYKEKDL